MKQYVLQLLADVFAEHLDKSCNYDKNVIDYSMKVEGGGAVPHGFRDGGSRPHFPPVPASLDIHGKYLITIPKQYVILLRTKRGTCW